MTDREKLIELLYNLPTPEPVIGIRAGEKLMTAGFIADHLIANGVVVREKGEWVEGRDYWRGDGEHIQEVDCLKCGEFADYATNFCPNCGADMRGAVKNG